MRKILKVIGVNVALLLAVALLAELIFGGWIGTNYGTLVIPKDFSRRFDVSHLYDTPGGTTYYRRDEHGLRGAYEHPSKIDILTIGGSTTNEIFIDEGKTWSDQIAQGFASEGHAVTVVNAGVDGQTTVGHLKNFELWFPMIPDLKARYVLAYVGINDYALAVTGYLNKQDHMEAQTRQIKQYLLNNSALYTLFRNIRGMVRARDAHLIHNQSGVDGTRWTAPQKQPDLVATERALSESLRAYADRLRRLVREIRNFGAEPILVTQHMGNYRIRDGRVLGRPKEDGTVDIGAYAGITAMNRETMRVCQEIGAICVDVAQDVVFEDGDHYDGLHTTPQGSRKIGRALHAWLKDRLSFN